MDFLNPDYAMSLFGGGDTSSFPRFACEQIACDCKKKKCCKKYKHGKRCKSCPKG